MKEANQQSFVWSVAMGERMVSCAEAGDLDGVRSFLPNICVPPFFQEAMCVACKKGHVEVLRFLLEQEVDLYFINQRLFHFSIQAGHVGVVELLLEYGADARSSDANPLIVAAGRGSVQIVKRLLAAGAKLRAQADRALFESVTGGHQETARILLQQGCDPNAQRYSILKQAVMSHDLPMLQLLIEYGGSLDKAIEFLTNIDADSKMESWLFTQKEREVLRAEPSAPPAHQQKRM